MATAEDAIGSLIYDPRPQFLAFHDRAKRWAVIVAHRRAGKTVACVMELLTRALATPKKDARYAYIAPFREQAKTVAWNYLKHYALGVVKDPATDFRESDLTVQLFNGSTVRLFGADNPNALRGMYLDGVVMDEYADMRPGLWGEVIRPTLSDRNGWAAFIGTPRGRNAFYEIVYGGPETLGAVNDPDWFHVTLRASETGLLPEGELADARKTMTENQYAQEYECSFDAAIIGAVYAKELLAARGAGRIRRVLYDASRLVHCAFDIGRRDATAIWWFQVAQDEVRILEYFEDNMEAAPYYASVLRRKEYQYDTVFLPHDADRGEAATGVTFAEVIGKNGFKVEVLPQLSLEDGINAARMKFPNCVFDESGCQKGLEALQAYHWAYNVRMGEIKNTPVHDWSSHGADAFRYLALAVNALMSQGPPPTDPYASFRRQVAYG